MATIRQTVSFKASPHAVYEALMDTKQHAAFTGAPARISRKVGGKISAYDGWIEGRNLELVKDKKIVQEWRGADWPSGVVSTATFSLARAPGGTRLTFAQTGVPREQAQAIADGWHEHYWHPMKAMLERDASHGP
ncbi:MAG: SRPBCC domain-containing protein [Candidatus Aenigmarchaeota archaeon]|nr:SRPBCC domain-containing protein [Candidatus Aenigmarchaeota archaeon]